MAGLLERFTKEKPVLLAVAAPAEARAVLTGLGGDLATAESVWRLVHVNARFDIVVTGVGKANAAGAVARVADATRHSAIVSVGLAGTLERGGTTLPLRAAIAGEAAVYADEGVLTPEGFQDVAQMGFAPIAGSGTAFAADPEVFDALRRATDTTGKIATVSTCSGTDKLAAEIARRTGAAAEEMEGAAVAHAARRLGVRFGEVRVISNTTGDRAKQKWELRGALERLSDVCAWL